MCCAAWGVAFKREGNAELKYCGGQKGWFGQGVQINGFFARWCETNRVFARVQKNRGVKENGFFAHHGVQENGFLALRVKEN